MPADDGAPAPLPFEIDHDLEQAKAFVRLRQAAIPVPEAFFTLRAGALVLQTVGGAILVLALAAAIVFALTDLVERTLDVPGYYLSVLTVLVGGGFGLFVLVAGELLTLQVVIARNTRLTTVILSEMNFAEASAREDLANRLVQRAGVAESPIEGSDARPPDDARPPSPTPAEAEPEPDRAASAPSTDPMEPTWLGNWFGDAGPGPIRREDES